MDASTTKVDQRAEWLTIARKVMETEAQAILTASTRLDRSLILAVETILGHSGKLIVMGLGKSGHVARKIAATVNVAVCGSVKRFASNAKNQNVRLVPLSA